MLAPRALNWQKAPHRDDRCGAFSLCAVLAGYRGAGGGGAGSRCCGFGGIAVRWGRGAAVEVWCCGRGAAWRGAVRVRAAVVGSSGGPDWGSGRLVAAQRCVCLYNRTACYFATGRPRGPPVVSCGGGAGTADSLLGWSGQVRRRRNRRPERAGSARDRRARSPGRAVLSAGTCCAQRWVPCSSGGEGVCACSSCVGAPCACGSRGCASCVGAPCACGSCCCVPGPPSPGWSEP